MYTIITLGMHMLTTTSYFATMSTLKYCIIICALVAGLTFAIKLYIYIYIYMYNTANKIPRFTLDGLVGYIAHTHDCVFYSCTTRVEPHVYTGQSTNLIDR